jgi:hypothetical protein
MDMTQRFGFDSTVTYVTYVTYERAPIMCGPCSCSFDDDRRQGHTGSYKLGE